ncbi:MAG: polysaccharide biosynthesis tyrosine autokinase [Luteitalea sp.]|nr:polysaccharide biosynthesis tyrosine autokinase [Luteitalea sp.]
MGRIDEALRRAGTGGASTLEREEGDGQTSAPPTSPWVFPGDELLGRASIDVPAPSHDDGTGEGSGPGVADGLAPGAVEGRRHARASASRAARVRRTPRQSGEAGELAVFRGFNPSVLDRLVVNDHTTPALAEQFRKLAATLHHAQLSDGIKVIMVTSGMAADGKTLTATNLALTLSESYRRDVLLIDADLRRPSLHEIFQVPNISGLNEGLQAAADEKLSTLRVTDTLTLLPAGRPNADPMSSLTSDRMRSIIDEASTSFHWVILDTPPIGLLADANLLADMVDGALLVVLAERTPYKVVSKAVDTVGRDRILGVVLNGSTTREETEYYERRYSAES